MWLQLASILATATKSVANTAAPRAAANNSNKKVVHKKWDPFTDCISKVNTHK